MKRFWALILTLAMVLQVSVAGVAFSEETETPTVTLTYVDENGETKTIELDPGDIVRDGDVRATNGLPNGNIEVSGGEDNNVTLNIDGKLIVIEKTTWDAALNAGQNATATVDGGIESSEGGIYAGDGTNVTVTGDVKAGREEENSYDDVNEETGEPETITGTDYYGKGVTTSGDAIVSISGSLISEDTAIKTSNKSKLTEAKETDNGDGTKTVEQKYEYVPNQADITVTGDVTSNHSEGIDVNGKATVTIKGGLVSEGTAIEASGNAHVTVEKDVESKEGNGILVYGQTNVGGETSIHKEYEDGNWVEGSSYYESEEKYEQSAPTIIINGNLVSEDTGIEMYGGKSTITVAGNVTSKNGGGVYANNSGHYDEEGKYVEDENQSIVSIGGDLTTYSSGVYAAGQSRIDIGGNLTAGHEDEREVYDKKTGKPTGETEKYYTGSGITAYDSAIVNVEGNVTSGNTAISANGSYDYKPEDPKETKNADGTTTVTYTTTYESTGAPTINVGGNVKSKDGSGVSASRGATVDIGGSVDAKKTGISASGDSSVYVGGDVNSDEGNGIVTNKESVGYTYSQDYDEDGNYIPGSYQRETTYATTAGNVEVDGDVTAKKRAAIIMTGDSNVTVWGDVTGGYVPEEVEDEPDDEPGEEYEPSAWEIARDEAWAKIVEGVEGAEYITGAVQIGLDKDGNDGQLIIGGTVSTYEDNVPIVLTYTVDDLSKLATMPELPEMKIYEIVPEGGEYFDVNVAFSKEFEFSYTDEDGKEQKAEGNGRMYAELSEEDHKAVIEAIAKSIQYIIKLNGEHASFTLDGAAYDAENDIYTAHEEEDVKVTVRPDEGYGLDGLTASGNYTLTDNGDGTWTLIIHRGGGVTLTATISERTISAPTTTNEEVKNTPPAFTHPALGKVVKFGHYDFDNDGTAEELEWKVIGVSNGYAQLALISLVDGVPEDFMEKAFDDTEKEALKEGETVFALSAETAKRFFQDPAGTEQVHLSIPVALTALVY